jgi:predicted tellurium resistance membrane protein TerC
VTGRAVRTDRPTFHQSHWLAHPQAASVMADTKDNFSAGFNGSQNQNRGVAFATLLAMEIVLGVDNAVFISILADKLPSA